MDMSASALPPRLPAVSPATRVHPLFSKYHEYRQSRIRLMIDCEEFSDWLACYQREGRDDEAAQHPEFPKFQQWMRANKGGARRCPAETSPRTSISGSPAAAGKPRLSAAAQRSLKRRRR